MCPGILWLHGGGYVLGSPEQDGASYTRVIEATGGVVVAPDYRLAPEAPYPAALDDCALALRWLRDNASDLGVRDDQLAVAGNSAGGGLAAALTLRERDLGEVAIAFQVPLYPMLDDRCATASALDNDAPVWDSVTNRNAWKVYLGDLSGSDQVPPYAAPARAADLSGLPPAFTYVGDLEPFRDEVVAYVERLRAAGVPVEFEVVPGAYHGFDVVAPGAPVSRRMLEAQSAWLRMAVRTWFAPQPERGSHAPHPPQPYSHQVGANGRVRHGHWPHAAGPSVAVHHEMRLLPCGGRYPMSRPVDLRLLPPGGHYGVSDPVPGR